MCGDLNVAHQEIGTVQISLDIFLLLSMLQNPVSYEKYTTKVYYYKRKFMQYIFHMKQGSQILTVLNKFYAFLIQTLPTLSRIRRMQVSHHRREKVLQLCWMRALWTVSVTYTPMSLVNTPSGPSWVMPGLRMWAGKLDNFFF